VQSTVSKLHCRRRPNQIMECDAAAQATRKPSSCQQALLTHVQRVLLTVQSLVLQRQLYIHACWLPLVEQPSADDGAAPMFMPGWQHRRARHSTHK